MPTRPEARGVLRRLVALGRTDLLQDIAARHPVIPMSGGKWAGSLQVQAVGAHDPRRMDGPRHRPGSGDFILVYFLALNLSYLILFLISLVEVVRFLKRTFFSDYQQILRSDLTLPISLLVPAHNEENTIVDTVRSLRMLNYPQFEIIVINDGSTDHTLERLLDAYELRRVDRVFKRSLPTKPLRGVYASPLVPGLTVVDKERGGKPDALNIGINLSRYPLFCSMDADSVIEEDALLKAVKPFMEFPDETIAVGGIVRCVNGCTVQEGRVTRIAIPRRPLPIFQVVEYLRAFLGGRLGWSALQALPLISGAFGVYRKSAVIDVGGYDGTTDTEDLELVLAMHQHRRARGQPYRIVFVPDPGVLDPGARAVAGPAPAAQPLAPGHAAEPGAAPPDVPEPALRHHRDGRAPLLPCFDPRPPDRGAGVPHRHRGSRDGTPERGLFREVLSGRRAGGGVPLGCVGVPGGDQLPSLPLLE